MTEKSGLGVDQEGSTASSRARPSLNPHIATPLPGTDDGWFYESRGGIEVIAVKDRVTTQVRIPWSKIVKSAARCGWTVQMSVDV